MSTQTPRPEEHDAQDYGTRRVGTGPVATEPLSAQPMETLARWVDEAAAAGSPSPRTFTFATVGPDGAPHARVVLSTLVDGEHIRFHSSSPTAKTRDVAGDPRASGVFFWPETGRQVIVHGTARELDAATSQAAYPTRPAQLRLVAWAYEDVLAEAGGGTVDLAVVASDVPTTREHVAERVAHHAGRGELEMPPSWTTLELTPARVDLWEGTGPATAAHKSRYDKQPDGTWVASSILP